jgi:hypothetical protein
MATAALVLGVSSLVFDLATFVFTVTFLIAIPC